MSPYEKYLNKLVELLETNTHPFRYVVNLSYIGKLIHVDLEDLIKDINERKNHMDIFIGKDVVYKILYIRISTDRKKGLYLSGIITPHINEISEYKPEYVKSLTFTPNLETTFTDKNERIDKLVSFSVVEGEKE